MKPQDNTQRLLLVGTTRAPSPEVLQKLRTLRYLAPRIVMIANPAFNFERRISQYFGAQDAYRSGGLCIERRVSLDDLREIADQEAPPAVLLGGGCPYTLLDEINRRKLQETLGEIARKSLLIGACAGAIALASGTAPAVFIDEATGNDVDIDPSRRREIAGLGLAPFDYVSTSSNPKNLLSRVPGLVPAYMRRSGSTQVVVARDGAGIYIERTPDGFCQQEFLGEVTCFTSGGSSQKMGMLSASDEIPSELSAAMKIIPGPGSGLI